MLFLCELSDSVGRKCYYWMGLQVPSQTNNVIFRGANVDWEAVLRDPAKLRAWAWINAKGKGRKFSYYEWEMNPRACLNCLVL